MNSEIKGNEKELLEMNEDDSTTYQNLQEQPKTVLTGKFIAISAYIKN